MPLHISLTYIKRSLRPGRCIAGRKRAVYCVRVEYKVGKKSSKIVKAGRIKSTEDKLSELDPAVRPATFSLSVCAKHKLHTVSNKQQKYCPFSWH